MASTVGAGDFGVVIPAREDHLHWVRGTCASVRHFMGDVPICVILDGRSFPDDLRRTYGVSVIRGTEVEPAELRAGFGALTAKDAALWAAPFETFLLLDADSVVWGDMRQLADFDHFDFVLDDGGEPSKSVMDLDAVEQELPGLGVRRHEPDFTNTGAYFGRRGTLDLDWYLELARVSAANPGMFYGSQGVFNLMVWLASDNGELRVTRRPLQVRTGRTTREEVMRRFAFEGGSPRVTGDPVVLHWVASPKPRVRAGNRDYFEPMTYFRREFRRASAGRTSPSATDDLHLRLEDALCSDWRGTNLRGRLARLRRNTGKRYRTLKVVVRRHAPDRLVSVLRGRFPNDVPSDGGS